MLKNCFNYFVFLCFDFTTTAELKRVAWSIICKILWLFISLRSIEITLKYLDKDNLVAGFKGAFLFFKQIEQSSHISSINSKSSLSSIAGVLTNFRILLVLECPNCLCSFSAIFLFSFRVFKAIPLIDKKMLS